MLFALILALCGCGGGPPPAVRPELPPPEAWAGSAACTSCHPAVAEVWAASWHARTVRGPSAEDLTLLSELLACSDLDAQAVLGGRHELRYLVERPQTPWGAGRWLALPCGWDKRTDAPSSHHPDAWRTRPWEQSCAGCHVTGFRGPEEAWAEAGVGCEACHGPAAEHARTGDPTRVVRFPETDESAVCGSCHLQGAKSLRTGAHVPDRFVPGADLYTDWVFDWGTLDAAASPIDVHQKRMIRDRHAERTTLQCSSCHALHDLSHDRHSRVPREGLCDACHEPDLSLKEYEQSCAVCEF